ncbi:MAG: aminotransferase DegT [Anaerolineales bacterium]|nr:DegT/DnrJ/EryC1/StrS family aminotransferase [Anaerolineae bacterium]PWB51806.1 MAG: aminotransferase DegT [Anaerolineales bacterium]
MINIAKPLIGEEEKKAVLEVLDSGMIAQGPRVKAFEESFARMCGVKYAVATTSGTTALHIALLAAGVGASDQVITSPFTFIASANSILYTGARPVFVDIDPETYNLDPTKIEAAITSHTKAILPVHLFGLSCDMDPIMEVAEKYGLSVIEDACQSHGAMYKDKRVGSFGIGTFSFYPTKNMTSAEGGMITTNHDGIAEHCQVIRQHGMRRRYYHDELGFNFRMTDVHAAIGIEQLKKLAANNDIRRMNASYLSQHLQGVSTPVIPQGCQHVFHQYTIRVPGGKRDELRAFLQTNGVGSEIYYPVPVHQQFFYAEALGYAGVFPEAERAAGEVLSLPVHPSLSRADLEKIVESVNQFCLSAGRQSDLRTNLTG